MKTQGNRRSHHDNVIHVPAERWKRAQRVPSTTNRHAEVHVICAPPPRPAMQGQLLRVTTSEDAMFFILIREVNLKDQEPFWEIGMLPSNGDDDGDMLALRFAEDIGWHAIRSRSEIGYLPRRFTGAMSTRDIRRRALLRCEDLARTMPGYDNPADVERMLLDAHIQPVTRTNALMAE